MTVLFYSTGMFQAPEDTFKSESHYAEKETPEDDPQTKFYKRHMTRTEAPHVSGRTPIYNFDAWAEAHYGKTFQRRQVAQKKYRNKQAVEDFDANGLKTELLVMGLLSGFVGFFLIVLQLDSGQDEVKQVSKSNK